MLNDAVRTSAMLLCTETSQIRQTAAHLAHLCEICRLRWLSRPCLDAVSGLVFAWNELHVCLPAGRVLLWLTDRITSWQAKTRSQLSVSDDQLAKTMNAGN